MLHRGFRAAKKAGVDVDEEQVIYYLVFSCLLPKGLQLYNLSEDPGELNNLAQSANASTSKVLSRLKEVAIGYYRCAWAFMG